MICARLLGVRRSVTLCACVLAAALASACGDERFACAQDVDCNGGATAGVCTDAGVCGFLDDGCPSGQRYGEHGGALSGECVPGDATTGLTEGSSATVSSTDAGEASLTASTTASTASTSTGDTATLTTPVGSSDTSITDATTLGETSLDPTATDGSTGEDLPEQPLIWLRFSPMQEAGYNDGLLGGTASCVVDCPDAFDGIGYFSGNSQCLELPSDVLLEQGPLSVALWLWPSDLSGPATFVGKPAGNAGDHSWLLSTDGNGAMSRIWAQMDGPDNAIVSDSPPQWNGWNHAVMTWQDDTLSLFIGGVLVGTHGTDMVSFDTSPVAIGCESGGADGPGDFFEGVMADVRVYGRVLTDDEITILASMTPPQPD